MKTKDSHETVKAFSSMITKRNRPKKIWVDKGTEFAGAFKTFCTAKGIQVHSTMSETKRAFAEHTIRSLKINLYRYMEDFGYRCIHKPHQFITTLNSRRNNSIDIRPNTVRIATLCLFFTVNLCENSRNLHSKLVIECKSQSMTCLFVRKGYKPQFTREVFEIVAIATRKPPTYTIKDEIIQGNFYQKELIKVI